MKLARVLLRLVRADQTQTVMYYKGFVNMRLLILAPIAAALMVVKAAAVVTIVPLGSIVVPPTQTFSPGVMFLNNGTNSAYYEFAISQPNTFAASSFTNTAVGKKGFFNFSQLDLYSGSGIGGALLETGTISSRMGGTETASLDPYTLGSGTYTIAYSGKVVGKPASVGSSITFAAVDVPEPAMWVMLLSGFGLVGLASRRRRAAVAA